MRSVPVLSVMISLLASLFSVPLAGAETVQKCKTVSAESLLTIGSQPAVLDKTTFEIDLAQPKSFKNQIGYLSNAKTTTDSQFVSMVKKLRPEDPSSSVLEFENLKNPGDIKWVYTLTGVAGERLYVYLFHEEKCQLDFMPLSAVWMRALHPARQ